MMYVYDILGIDLKVIGELVLSVIRNSVHIPCITISLSTENSIYVCTQTHTRTDSQLLRDYICLCFLLIFMLFFFQGTYCTNDTYSKYHFWIVWYGAQSKKTFVFSFVLVLLSLLSLSYLFQCCLVLYFCLEFNSWTNWRFDWIQ